MPALRAAALSCPLPVQITAEGLGRYPPEVETNIYFSCIEAIQNSVKHAGPGAAIAIHLDGRHGLSVDITDTGRGADPAALRAGHGITNIADRIGAVGGTLTIDTSPGHGLHIHAELLDSAAPAIR